MAVFAPALSFLWEGAGKFGLDPEELFAEAGIDPQLRLDVNARVSAEQYDRLISAEYNRSGDDAFAFHVVESLHPSYMGALGYATMTCASLRKAFELLHRYFRLLADDLSVDLEEQDKEMHVVLSPGMATERDPEVRERLRLANAVQLCRLISGPSFRPARVWFRQPQPPRPAACYEFFRCELQFGKEKSVMVIDSAAAERALPGYNAQLETLLEKQIVEYLARLDQPDIVSRTRSVIFDLLPTGQATIEAAAARLHTSVRTLRRKLSEQGTSFKELLSRTRKDLGERYIADKNLSLTEIAFLLGFSDSSSFSRAYRSWTGRSPTAYRAEHGGS